MFFGWFNAVFSIVFPLIFFGLMCLFIFTLISNLRTWNKNNHSPRLSIPAAVVAKRTDISHSDTANAGDLSGAHGYRTSTYTSYYVTFQVESGDRMEFEVDGSDYGLLVQGDIGKLSFQGTRYLGLSGTKCSPTLYSKECCMNDLFIQGLTIDWNRVRPYNYIRQIPAISGIDTFTFHKPITFFVGENGSGKSTLLEAIAVAYGFNAEGGTKNYSFSTYNSHSELCEAMTISKGYRRPKFGYFLRAESFYNVATKEIDYSDDDHPSKGYHQKSHGESFLAIAQDYMGADGVYIFDEPEAALSPQRQLTLLINIYRCAQEGAQFIIVSHSPILLGMPDAEIFSFDNGTIHPCQYEDTDSYVITKTFVNNRQHFLNQLLNEET